MSALLFRNTQAPDLSRVGFDSTRNCLRAVRWAFLDSRRRRTRARR